MNNAVLELTGVSKSFRQGENVLHVLQGCGLSIGAGQLCALVGPSGAGKSTLLQICGLLDRADTGQIRLDGADVSFCNDQQRTMLRRQSIGFVYQYHHLLPEFSALENVILPQMIAGVAREKARQRAMELLELVELTKRADHRPARLSGGEQQRVALVRALANNPKLLIADEPTGNLDPGTAENVFGVLQNLVKTQNFALLMATHNHDLAKRMKCVVEIKGGVLK